MSTIYLCGPINNRSDVDCKDWRDQAKLLLKEFSILDPMRRDYRGDEQASSAEIIEKDKADVDSSDGLLVYFDQASFGTAMEIFYAYLGYKKIVAVNASGLPTSPWVTEHVDYVANGIEEGCEMLKKLLTGGSDCHARNAR